MGYLFHRTFHHVDLISVLHAAQKISESTAPSEITYILTSYIDHQHPPPTLPHDIKTHIPPSSQLELQVSSEKGD